MIVKSDSAMFEAFIADATKKAEEEIDSELELDSFTETDEYKAMINKIYKSIMADIHKKPKRKIIRKLVIIAAAVAVTFACVFNVSAFRLFFYKTYLDVRGDILNIETDTQGMAEQYASIDNFKYKDEIMVPGWLPKGTELVKIDDTVHTLMLTYSYDDTKITLTEKSIVDIEWKKSTNVYLKNSLYEVDNFTVDGSNISVVSLKGTTGKKSYTAVWNNDTVEYTLKAETEEDLLYAILYSLKHIG